MSGVILSVQNDFVRTARTLKDKKGRMEQGAFLVEGVKCVNELLAHQPSLLRTLIITEDAGEEWAARARSLGQRAVTVAPLGLEGLVTELYLDHSGDAPAAVVTLRLLVLDERTPSFTVLATHEAQARVAYTPSAPAAASEAFGQALTQTLEALAAALAGAPGLPR